MLKNVGANWMLTIVQILVGFLIMPFSIHMLGQDQYGTWLLIASLTSYLSMLTLGIPMATVRFVAKYSAEGDQAELDRTIGSCAGLYVMIGGGALIIGTALLGVFHFVYHVTPALRSRADIAFMIVVVNVAFSFIAQLPFGIMSAHHDFVVMNKIHIGGQLVRLGLVFLFLSLDASLLWLAVVQVSVMTFELTLSTRTVRRRYPHIHVRFRDFDWAMVRQIFSFSLFVLLLQVGTQLAFQTDSLVIGAFLPISTIPFFAVAGSLAMYLTQFMVGISGVVMPTATALEARGAMDELRAMFLRWSKITASLTFVAGLFLIVLGPRFIAWWIKPEFEGPSGSVLQILMIANLVFLPMRGVSLPVLVGLGRPARATVAFFIAAVVNLGLSIALVRPLGIDGVALGTAIPNIAYGIYIGTTACQALGVRVRHYATYAFGRPVLGALPVLAFLLVLRDVLDVRGVTALVASGIATLAVFGLLSIGFVYQRDPHVDVSAWIGRLTRWRQA